MANEMKRGRSQVIWRYTPGATYRYNDSGAWCRTTEITLQDPKPMTGALASAVSSLLRTWQAVSPDKFPDPIRQPQRYAVGEPYQVSYTLFPLVFTCRRCGRVHYYSDLGRLAAVNDRLACMTCKERDLLRQVSYAYVCECGRLDSISMQKHDRTHPIELVDKGSFRESYWRCKVCGTPLYRDSKEGLGFRRCECAPKKGKRGVVLEDNRVYYSHSITLVEIAPAALERWADHPRFGDLLVAASLGLEAYRGSHLQDLATYREVSDVLSPELKAMVEMLVTAGMPRSAAEAMARSSAAGGGGNAWTTYEKGLAPLRTTLPPVEWSTHRPTIEYVFVRYEPSIGCISLDLLAQESRKNGDTAGEARYQSDRAIADDLGLVDLCIVQALPTVLAGVGYSRYSAAPRDDDGETGGAKGAELRPYSDPKGRIPIYVARNTTEALLYHLDPWRVAAYLTLNTDVEISREALSSTGALRAWLMATTRALVERNESHFVLRKYEIEAGVGVEERSALVFGVLHTVSHVLKATADRFVGLDGDSLAEYLFPSVGAGLLYASRFVQFTLGGIDSAFKSNLRQWLGSARDYAGQCAFDPVCATAGGACLACLYPKFGCAYFNRTVSRAFLFGGVITGRERRVEGYWSAAVKDAVRDLKPQQV